MLFEKFLGDNLTIGDLSKQELNTKLRLFFASVRNRQGELLKKSTLANVRYGLGKFLKEEFHIDNDPEFSSSKEVFRTVGVDLKKKGKGSLEHKSTISEDDMRKLHDPENIVFNPKCPAGLQRKVWFDLMYFLCRRGRENLRDMTKTTFSVARDTNGNDCC